MRFVERSAYVGPNLYASFPVIRFRVDLGPLEAWPSVRLGNQFIEQLLEALPGLREHGCSYGEPGGFVRRLTEDEGTWMGHVLEHVAIDLQNMAGENVTFGKTRGTGTDGEYDVVYEYEDRKVGLAAGTLAKSLLLSLLPDEAREGIDDFPEDFDWEDERDSYIRFAQRNAFGPSTAALVRAAEERDVPWLRSMPGTGPDRVEPERCCVTDASKLRSWRRHVGACFDADSPWTERTVCSSRTWLQTTSESGACRVLTTSQSLSSSSRKRCATALRWWLTPMTHTCRTSPVALHVP